MARKSKKSESPADRLARLVAGQVGDRDAIDAARESWEAGQAGHFDYTDDFGQVFHIEACPVVGGYVVVAWDDNGDVSWGGL